MTDNDEVPARTRAAEDRRAFRDLLDASSLGTPGVKARIRRSEGRPLTAEEQAAADEDERDLDRALTRPWRRQDP